MKTVKIIFISLGALILLALIAGFVIIRSVRQGAVPKYEGEIVAEGLSDAVTIYRDERGMPHIYAGNEKDLYFAVGFVMAQERLWQMDLIRRATRGRLSEIFGKDYVQTDLFLRSLDMTTKSKMILSNVDPEILLCLNAYADGVNSFINSSGKRLPPEFRILGYKPDPWKLEDIANIIGYMGWDLASGNLSADIFNHRLIKKLGAEKAAELIPTWQTDNTYAFPDFHLDEEKFDEALNFITSMEKLGDLGIVSFSGSNNWAVSGKRTETGKPILSNDMHLGLSSPGIWIQIHEVIPGKLNVTGVAVPGQPFIVAGHNERIAWGMTNLSVDDIDLFAEKINPENHDQYFFNGQWKDLAVREEIIKIKGEEADTFQLKFTHRGPIISELRKVDDAALSMRWSGYDKSDEIKSVYLLNRANNWDGFRYSLSFFRSISQNFAYADVDGNIGLNTGGGVAIRKGSGSLIRNGETDEYDWKGYVPFDQLPFSFNPENGHVSSANNKTVDDSYPYYIGTGFALPYRINRIRQILDEKEILGIEDFKNMLLDQHSDYAALLTPFILQLQNRKDELTEQESEALDLLSNWDYDMNAGMAAPSVFEFFRISFIKNLLSDEIGDMFDQLPHHPKDYYIYRILKTGPDDWVDNKGTPAKETLDDILITSFKDCISALSEGYGTSHEGWKWGNIHKISMDHPLGTVKLLDRLFGFNSDLMPVGGSNHTVSPYSFGAGFKVNHGASERHIFNTADWDESFTIIPTGESGVPASEFYLSQFKNYLEGKFYKDAFSEDAVKSSAKYRLILKPS